MKHLFKAKKLGWGKEKEAIWFDADEYTVEEAREQFIKYEGITQKGYPYIGYEYKGQQYYDIVYLGEYEDDEMPENDLELLDILIKRIKNS